MEDYLTIGDVARFTGLATSAIRFYESQGLLKSERTEGGQRRFDGSTVTTVKLIQFAKSAGFTLKEINGLVGVVDQGLPLHGGLRELVENKLIEMDELISRAEATKSILKQALTCDCDSHSECPLVQDA